MHRYLALVSVLGLACLVSGKAPSPQTKRQLVMDSEFSIVGAKGPRGVRVVVPNGSPYCRIVEPDGGSTHEYSKLCAALHEALESK